MTRQFLPHDSQTVVPEPNASSKLYLRYSECKGSRLVTQINILLSCQNNIPTRAVAQLLEALRCDPKVAGSVLHRVIDLIFNLHYGPGLDLASNRNEYQGYLLRVKAVGAYG